MINLKPDLFIGKGGNQATYHHPSDEQLCVKVNLPGRQKISNKRLSRELKLYKSLQRKAPSPHVPQFFGTIETNLGKGYLYEKVTDFEGSVSQDLHTTLCSIEARDENMIQAIRTLGLYLLNERILFHDGLLRDNTLCRKTKDSTYELVVIDGLGDTILIPVLSYIPSHARSRIRKKWEKYMIKETVVKHPWIKRSDLII